MPTPSHTTPFESSFTDADTLQSQIDHAASYIESCLPSHLPKPNIAIICGSGLGNLCKLLNDTIDIPYESIPGFVKSTVQGHAGKLVFGTLGKQTVLCMVGRFHKYEGYTMAQVTFPIRVFAVLKVKLLIVTNAAGGIHPNFKVGDIMVIEDHIGIPLLAGNNPLVGPNLSNLGPRFPSMLDMYHLGVRQLVFEVAMQSKIAFKVHSGIYGYVSGPQYETKTELRWLKTMGVDAVGMSTVPEVVIARHAGIPCLGLSLITNLITCEREVSLEAQMQSYLQTTPKESPSKRIPWVSPPTTTVTHEEVLKAGVEYAEDVLHLVKQVLLNLPDSLFN